MATATGGADGPPEPPPPPPSGGCGGGDGSPDLPQHGAQGRNDDANGPGEGPKPDQGKKGRGEPTGRRATSILKTAPTVTPKGNRMGRPPEVPRAAGMIGFALLVECMVMAKKDAIQHILEKTGYRIIDNTLTAVQRCCCPGWGERWPGTKWRKLQTKLKKAKTPNAKTLVEREIQAFMARLIQEIRHDGETLLYGPPSPEELVFSNDPGSAGGGGGGGGYAAPPEGGGGGGGYAAPQEGGGGSYAAPQEGGGGGGAGGASPSQESESPLPFFSPTGDPLENLRGSPPRSRGAVRSGDGLGDGLAEVGTDVRPPEHVDDGGQTPVNPPGSPEQGGGEQPLQDTQSTRLVGLGDGVGGNSGDEMFSPGVAEELGDALYDPNVMEELDRCEIPLDQRGGQGP